MQLSVRIKASEKQEDIKALQIVGGRVELKSYPMFVFSSGTQRRSYDEIRRRIRGGESIEAIARSYQVSGGASGVSETPAETR